MNCTSMRKGRPQVTCDRYCHEESISERNQGRLTNQQSVSLAQERQLWVISCQINRSQKKFPTDQFMECIWGYYNSFLCNEEVYR